MLNCEGFELYKPMGKKEDNEPESRPDSSMIPDVVVE
jgi:hypothetical protein